MRTAPNLGLAFVARERMPHRYAMPSALLGLGLLVAAAVFGSTAAAQEFKGKVGRSYAESVESYPERVQAPAGAPNVVVILWDDAGFAHWSSYGGSIPTPSIDKLAANGLRYTGMHNTALCAASRAALLGGRNPHSVGFGAHLQTVMGFPGYNNSKPKDKAAFPQHLQAQGYATWIVGKFDNLPLWEVTSAGPFDNWPDKWGFDKFYGTPNAEFDNFRTPMFADHTPIEPWKETKGWTFAEDIGDKAVEMITKHVSTDARPFFLYFTPSAPHSPHQAPAEYIARFKGKFDKGWDVLREEYLARQKKMGLVAESTKLTPRPKDFPAWDSLPADKKRLFARQMEVNAGMVAQADDQVGKIVAVLERTGQLDNTLIIVTSDNGPAGEGGVEGAFNLAYYYNIPTAIPFEVNNKYLDQWGGPETYPQYSAAWANVSSTPFFGFKQLLSEGGTLAPFVVHWPKGIKAKGEMRTQYHHFDDIASTILEATGVKFLETVDGVKQKPFEGVSMAYSFADANAPTTKKIQHYELLGQRAIWKDGWKALANHGGRMPWSSMLAAVTPFEEDRWQLYNLNEDPSETNDLAAKFPEKVTELVKLWDREAAKYNVFPLDDRIQARAGKVNQKLTGGKTEFTYYFPGAWGIVESMAPPVKNNDHTIRTDMDLKGDEEGVIACMGGQGGGWSLFIKDHQVYYVYNALGMQDFVLTSGPLPTGTVRIGVGYTKKPNLQGDVELAVNDKVVDKTTVGPVAITFFSMDETFDIGRDTGTPVSPLYRDKGDFEFHGMLNKVVINVGRK